MKHLPCQPPNIAFEPSVRRHLWRAVCVRCGASKRAPNAVCPACQFDPTLNEDDLIRSVYLSTGCYADLGAQQRYLVELERASVSLLEPPASPRLRRAAGAREECAPAARSDRRRAAAQRER